MKRAKPGTVRIIGGRWRGTRLPVPDLPGLRPSGDRGRETLFNWLQAHIRKSRCADLFAGSGALGLEAASRGAAEVWLVEKSRRAAQALEASLARLNGEGVHVIQGDALAWLTTREPRSLDILFVDPPFGSGLEQRVLEVLNEGNCLARDGLLYLETARDSAPLPTGHGWETVREKTVGDVRMQLLKKV